MAEESQDRTRQRVLEVAAEMFAEQGFRNTTVRDICSRAGANVAAVNYHFGGKEGLYREVFRFAHACLPRREFDPETLASAPPEQVLRNAAMKMLTAFLDGGQPALFGRLMAREMFEPTEVLDEVIEQEIRPMASMLRSTIQRIAGGTLSEEQLAWCHYHLVAQALFYRNARPVISRLDPELAPEGETLRRLGEHIADFAIAGIKSLSE